MTSGVDSVFHQHPSFFQFIADCLTSQSSDDFGTLCHSDVALNQTAIHRGGRVISSYAIPSEIDSCSDKLWVITESDRSSTTVLFLGEY